MWTLVLFFGASVLFTSVRNVARDETTGVQIGAQAVAGLILIGVIAVYLRRRP
jgi:tetrahydromethanopterin S-methyltransferase subunit E